MGSESAFQTHSQSHNTAHHLEERHNPHMSRNLVEVQEPNQQEEPLMIAQRLSSSPCLSQGRNMTQLRISLYHKGTIN